MQRCGAFSEAIVFLEHFEGLGDPRQCGKVRYRLDVESRIEEAVREGYHFARLDASSETDLDLERFPDACPYGWNDIMGRAFVRGGGGAG